MLELARSSVEYEPVPMPDLDLALVRRIDARSVSISLTSDFCVAQRSSAPIELRSSRATSLSSASGGPSCTRNCLFTRMKRWPTRAQGVCVADSIIAEGIHLCWLIRCPTTRSHLCPMPYSSANFCFGEQAPPILLSAAGRRDSRFPRRPRNVRADPLRRGSPRRVQWSCRQPDRVEARLSARPTRRSAAAYN